jgi:DNA-binding beta-propeller fold protein YncE/uncharacterized protein (DUF2141 family)
MKREGQGVPVPLLRGRRGGSSESGLRAVRLVAAVGLCLAATTAARAQSPAGSFVNFESGHVRPLAKSPDGTKLFAVNTPDNRLAIFDVTAEGLALAGEVPVGLEPVAVAARSGDEVWVVNHLSDSVSIVRIDPVDPALSRVVRTLHTCDEPRDILFAGPGGNRAFVTAARRGQRCPVAPNPTVEGIGRALVQVFDANALGAALGGTPIANLVLFADTPRALARNGDGSRVWAAAFHSGNQTTAINETLIPDGGEANGGLPDPPASAFPGGPEVGLIVKRNPISGNWEDETGRNFSSRVAFDLPDLDLFEVDANATPPVEVSSVASVGTVLFSMAIRPGTQRVFVGNLDSRNEVRFEGIVPDGEHGVRGHIAENHVSVVEAGSVEHVHLNSHIDFTVSPGPASEVEESEAFPTGMTFNASGSILYFAAFGSRRVVALDASALEAGVVAEERIPVGGGPTGVVVDEARDRLYVMNRFDQRVGIVTSLSDPTRRAQTATVGLRYDPSPAPVKKGRRHLYEASLTSGHGDAACASCHIFGDMDDLAWDLGDASDEAVPAPNPNPFRTGSGTPFHPLKGPMTTQSLRGLADAGPMHWRGDRTGGAIGGDPLDEELAFLAFNPAFVGLMGRAEEIPEQHMQEFTDFVLTMRYPPNPIRALDDVPTAAEASGATFFSNTPVDGGNTCAFCHGLPLATDGFSTTEGETQEFKVPHMRNLYQKVGMFGVPPGALIPATGDLGPQVRGFGFLHDGSLPSVFNFYQAPQFNFANNTLRRNVEAFGFAFDTGLAPMVGQQISIDATSFNQAGVIAAIEAMIDRDEAGDCDLIVKGGFSGEVRGAIYAGSDQFLTDRASEGAVGKAGLRNLAQTPGNEQTYTCVPPGAGVRMAVDRDGDGRLDRDEIDAGTDPSDPSSFAGQPQVVTIRATRLLLKDDSSAPVDLRKRKITFKSNTRSDAAANQVVPPLAGSAGDPVQNGARLLVYNANGSGEQIEIPLPAAGWLPLSGGWRFAGDSSDPVQSVVVKENSITLRGGGSAWSYTLDEPVQGRLALRLTLGSGVTWCIDAPAKLSGRPPSSARNDTVDKFLGAPRQPAPAICPVAPLGGSPSGAFLDGPEERFF